MVHFCCRNFWFGDLQIKNTVGVHKFYAVAIETLFFKLKEMVLTDITIDNIKIKRLNGDDTPRIDYTDGGCPVLLTEPQSTNLIVSQMILVMQVGLQDCTVQ